MSTQFPERPDTADSFDQSLFRHVVGHFASGVTVITTNADGTLFGTTASAVTSLSMEPPMMLACLNRSSATHAAIVDAGRFAINILAIDQGTLASHFGRKGDDKFASVEYSLSPRGLPLLDGALATIECLVSETATGGTHTVFLGSVQHASSREGEPLAYYRGRFDALEHSSELSVYEQTRDWVLRRRTPLGETLDPAFLAREFACDPAAVYNALVRLVAENVVTAGEDGGCTPTPLTAELVDNLYDARASIEAGVLAEYLESALDERIAPIVAQAEALIARSPQTSEELDDFLEANLEFHCSIVGLADSRQLVAHFRQLSIATVWRETYRSDVWRDRTGHPLIPQIAAALTIRDAAGARALVRQQVDFVKQSAKQMIQEHGGAL